MVYTVIVREAFEALLIVGILFAVASKSHVSMANWSIGTGAGLGLLASALMAFSILNMSEYVSDKALLFLEIAFPAIAAAMIFYTVWWMQRYARANSINLQSRAGELASQNRFWSLAIITGLAVTREGAETVLFLSGEIMQETIKRSFYISALLAMLTSVMIYFSVTSSLQRIGLKWFFSISSVALVISAVKLVFDMFNQMASRGLI